MGANPWYYGVPGFHSDKYTKKCSYMKTFLEGNLWYGLWYEQDSYHDLFSRGLGHIVIQSRVFDRASIRIRIYNVVLWYSTSIHFIG